MKNLLIITLLLGSFSALGQSHTVKGFINGVNPGDTVFMGAYSGKSLQYNDTTVAAADGWFSFQGKTKEKAGKHVVFILKPSVKMVEVLLDEKDLVFKTDTSNMDLNMKVVKSETNKIFYDYKKFIHGKNLERTPLDKACGDTLLTEEQRKPSCDKIRKLTEEVIAEQTRIADEHYDLLIGKYLKMGLEVEVPEAPKNEENAQVWRYQYYRAHYWDNTDLNDPAIFREQQFHKLFEKYFKKVVPQNPDSVFNAGVEFLNKIQGKEDLQDWIKQTEGQLCIELVCCI